MNTQTQQLQACVDMLAERYVPALRGAKVICFVRSFEVWINPHTTLVVGSYGTVMLWLGCVAVTKRLRSYEHFEPHILHQVICSAERAGVL